MELMTVFFTLWLIWCYFGLGETRPSHMPYRCINYAKQGFPVNKKHKKIFIEATEMREEFALQLQNAFINVRGSILSAECVLPAWSLHVLAVPEWVFSGCSCFFP